MNECFDCLTSLPYWALLGPSWSFLVNFSDQKGPGLLPQELLDCPATHAAAPLPIQIIPGSLLSLPIAGHFLYDLHIQGARSALPVGIQLRRHPRNCLPNKSVPNNKYLYIAHYARFCTYLCSATAWFLLLPILSFKSGSKVYIMLFTMQWTCQVYEMDIITRLLSSWAWEQEYAEKYAMYFNVLVNQ